MRLFNSPRQGAYRRIGAVLAVGVLALAACGGDDSGDDDSGDDDAGTTTTAAGDNPSFEEEGVTITMSGRSLSNQSVFAADDGGFFECYGIDADLVISESSAVAMAALLSGDAQFAAGARSEGALTRASGQNVSYLLKHSSGFATGVTVSNEVADSVGDDFADAPLEERIQALEGRTIATPAEGSILTLLLQNLLNEHDVEVEFTYIEGASMGAALSQGNIDGYMFPSPFQETTVANGDGQLLIDPTELPIGGPDAVQGPVYVTDGYMEDNPEIVARLVAALLDTAEWTRDNSDAAKELAHSRFEDLSDEIMDLVWETNYESYITPLDSPLTVEDLEFIIQNDAPDRADVQALDAADLMPDEAVIERGRELADQVDCEPSAS